MSFKSERQTIADLIAAAGINAYAYVPGRVGSTPAAVVHSGNPYFEPPDTFGRGRFRGHWIIEVLVSANVSKRATDDGDDLTEDAIVALLNAGYTVELVDGIANTSLNGATYQSTRFQISKQITI